MNLPGQHFTYDNKAMTKKLEEEIKSVNFRSVRHKATLNIIVTANWIHTQHLAIFKKYNLTGQQFNVLRILRGQYPNPSTVLNIRERMLDKMSDVSRIIERLRISGYIDRVLCPNDRRAVDISVTKKGLDLLKKLDKEEEAMELILGNLSSVEATQLNELLDKIRD